MLCNYAPDKLANVHSVAYCGRHWRIRILRFVRSEISDLTYMYSVLIRMIGLLVGPRLTERCRSEIF